MLTPT
jgi:hypothetical protein